MATGDLTTLANVKQWLGLTGLPILSITNTNPAVLTLAAVPSTPLLNGGTYDISGSAGIVGTDGSWVITKISATSFSIPFDSTTAGTYTSGAIVGISDPLLARLITAASTAVQTWLGRIIAQAVYTESRDGLGQPTMMFKNYPVTAVASVAINGASIQARPALGPTVTATSFGGYVFDENRLMLNGLIFSRGFQNVQIQYTAGYPTTPADLEQAVIDIIGDWFKYRDRIGVSSMGIDGQSISLTNFVQRMMPIRAQMILDQYRRVMPVV